MAHYFEQSPAAASAPRQVQLDGGALTLRSDRGVFSHGRLDPGTAMLLREAPDLPRRGHCSTSAAASGRSR